jgi:hypothetical protein
VAEALRSVITRTNQRAPRLGFVGTEVIIDIAAAEIMGKQFWVIQNSQIPLSQAVRRAIRAYREKKPGGFVV